MWDQVLDKTCRNPDLVTFSARLMTPPSKRRSGEKMNMVLNNGSVCNLSLHGSHTYIEAYLFSMIITAYLCTETVYFLFILDVLCVAGFVMFVIFSSVANRRQWFITVVTEHMV